MRRAAALLAALALAGCGGGDDDAGTGATTGGRPIPPPATTTTAPPTVPTGEAAEAEQAFRDFVAAAARADAAALWDGLSAGSRERLGPTEQEFSAEAADRLQQGLGSVDPDSVELLVAETFPDGWALVAVALGDAVFATPLHREDGRYRVDIGGVVTVDPEVPRPGGAPAGPNVRARVDAAARPDPARIWLDGRALPTTIGQAGVIAAPLGGLGPGRHTVVAYAQTPDDAAATAWTFQVPG